MSPSSFCITCCLCPTQMLWACPGGCLQVVLQHALASFSDCRGRGGLSWCGGRARKDWRFSTLRVTSNKWRVGGSMPPFLSPQRGDSGVCPRHLPEGPGCGWAPRVHSCSAHYWLPSLPFLPSSSHFATPSQCFLNKLLLVAKFLSQALQLEDPN